jgi:hypothetical protein
LIIALISSMTRIGVVLLLMRQISAATTTRCLRSLWHLKAPTLGVVYTHVQFSM